jgi:hypothetical protein
MALVAAVGLGVFFISHDRARMVGAGMFGFASAFAFVLNLVLPPLLAETSGDVHRISAGMFTIGYGLALPGSAGRQGGLVPDRHRGGVARAGCDRRALPVARAVGIEIAAPNSEGFAAGYLLRGFRRTPSAP